MLYVLLGDPTGILGLMDEFIARLKRNPKLSGKLITAALLSNLLALASPLFVMQVLNRYVSHGVDSTLATLSFGTLAAVVMEFFFRRVRHRMADDLNTHANEEVRLAGFSVLAHGKISTLEQIPAGKRREIVSGATDVESIYSSTNINIILDLPFSILFLFILYLLSPLLSLIASVFIGVLFISALLGAISVRDDTSELRNISSQSSGVLETAIREGDTIHAFNAASVVKKSWFETSDKAAAFRAKIASDQGFVQTMTQSGTAVMSIAIISVGAILAVAGELDAGAMIGANILATRAMQPTSKFAQLGASLAKAKQSLAQLRDFVQIPLEPDKGSAKENYSGSLELRDLAFFFPSASGPLFESLSLEIAPGNIMIIVGNSGAGKTTLARILVGLLDPVRGQVLVDGMDLRQVSPEWWRKQIVYLPQEPTFLNASIAENLGVANPEADMARMNAAIQEAGLRTFVDETSDGIETMINDNGRQLAVGVRRSLALARALMSDGRFVIIDEMFDGFDVDGRAAVNAVINRFASEGRSIVIMSHQASRMEGITAIVDLNSKPQPRITFFGENYNPADVKRGQDEA
jgi:ATP-binding cassette, subfamily C, bacterial LapB